MPWRGRVEDLLYDGESVESTVELGDDSRVAVTSHRVLAFTPELEGANFRDVDRPNVEGVDTSAQADAEHLGRGVRWTIIGAVMLVAGSVVDISAIIGNVNLADTAAGSEIGVGGILGSMEAILDLLKQLPTLLLYGGAVFLVAGIALLALYIYQRDRTLVIEVAGGDDLHVPRPEGEDAVARLERALGLTDEAAASGGGEDSDLGLGEDDDPLADSGGGSGGFDVADEDESGDDGGWSDDPW